MAINNFKYFQGQPFALAGGGAIAGATTLFLQSMTDIDGNALSMSGTFGTKGFGTLDPGNGTLEEQISFTGLTNNANGTVTLTGVSSVTFVYPYTESSGLAKTHAGATPFVISNTAGFYNKVVSKDDDATVTGKITFPNDDVSNAGIATDTDTAVATAFVTLGQLSRQAISGASNASTTVKGIVQLPTQVQVDAKTTTGSTGALLALTPDKQRSTLLSDYVVDTGAADAYVITPVPAIAAYTTGQIFSFKSTHTNTTTSTLNVNALGVKTIKKLDGATNLAAGDIVSGQIITVEYDGTNFQMLNPVGNTPLTSANLKFGGTGADGALAISSGTTTLDCAGASFLVKNYTSISITGTGVLAFSNAAATGTLIILKSQGAVTLTSSATPMINCTSLGATGGAQVTGSNASGNVGTNGGKIALIATNGGGAPTSGGAGGTAGAVPSAISVPVAYILTLMKYPLAFVGAGGSSGATANGAPTNSGAGGRGGGGLIIECAGALNFTTASGISVAGANGANAVEPSTPVGGGGGGGGGGFALIIYNTLTAASGTITITGGTGGNSGASGSGQTRSGGAGGGSVNAGSSGTTTTSANTKCGGDGATGLSLVTANTEFD